MFPEKCPRGSSGHRELSTTSKANLQEVQVVFKAQYDRMSLSDPVT